MNPILAALAATALLAAAAPAAASPNTEATKACFSDNTSGKDRKVLGKWIFLAMAAHPEIASMSAATAAEVEQSERDLAALFMRLVTEDCAAQMKKMMTEDGATSISVPFEYLGQIAMQELTTHESVNTRITGFHRFLDTAKLEAAIGQ